MRNRLFLEFLFCCWWFGLEGSTELCLRHMRSNKETLGTPCYVVPQDLSSLSCLHSFHLSESSYTYFFVLWPRSFTCGREGLIGTEWFYLGVTGPILWVLFYFKKLFWYIIAMPFNQINYAVVLNSGRFCNGVKSIVERGSGMGKPLVRLSLCG